jgi:hypothetical protein
MQELQVENALIVQRIMIEYESVLDTYRPFQDCLYGYVPNIFDVLNAFPDVNPHEAIFEIIKIMHQHKVFFRYYGEYAYVPFEEVW